MPFDYLIDALKFDRETRKLFEKMKERLYLVEKRLHSGAIPSFEEYKYISGIREGLLFCIKLFTNKEENIDIEKDANEP